MIQLEQVTKIYDLPSGGDSQAHIVAADRLTLDVPAGQIFGLIGPNGAGKTTTLKMICGLLAPTAGRVVVNGVSVERQPEEAQQFIGYVADFFSLYDDLKVWEYLDYFAHAYRMAQTAIPGRITRVVQDLGLAPKLNSFIAGLSRGMKQRLGIARAILHDPPLLVLDEPTVGVDPTGRVELKDLFRRLHGDGKTIFITSHLLADLEEICSAVAIMEKGRLLRVGPLSEIMREAAGARRVRISLASSGFGLSAWLSARPGVAGVVAEPSGAQFLFAGSDSDLADLIRALIQAGAAVTSVKEETETLERVFSRISKGEVM